MHDFAIVGVGAESASPILAEARHSHYNTMTWTPTATRADVVRMIARYVRLEFSIRSGAGRLAIDESRAPKRRFLDDRDIDIHGTSYAEFRDAIKTLVLRRAVYAKPEAPQHTSSDPRMQGTPIRRVAPLRDVAAVVKLKSKLGGGGVPQASAREWRATVAQKISKAGSQVLVEAEQLRLVLKETRNQLEAARRAAGRLRGGGRNARNLKRHADERVAELRSLEELHSDQLGRLVKTRAYQHGIDALLEVCTRTAEIEAYCFGEGI